MNKTTTVAAKTTYRRVSKNISKTGNAYRVRVCGTSCTCKTQREAYAMKKTLLAKHAS